MSSSFKYNLEIKTKAWREQKISGSGLIDFEQELYKKDSFNIKSEGVLYFSKNKIKFSEDDGVNDKILEIKKDDYGKYYINCEFFKKNMDLNLNNNGAFMIYRYDFFRNEKNLKNQRYTLDIGDIIKIGKIYMKILEIKFQDLNKKLSTKYLLISQEYQQSKNRTCRICYDNSSSQENPLINPCQCKGSLKYIHYKCLSNWLKNKIEKLNMNNPKNNYLLTFPKALFNCELCKSQIPLNFSYNNNVYSILSNNNNLCFKNFVIIETLNYNGEKNINLISLDDRNKITIGRSKKCDFYFQEKTVSRNHCIININHSDKKLFLQDENSTYGTLVLIRNNQIKINETPLRLQIKSVYIKIKMFSTTNTKKSLFDCCNVETKNDLEKNEEYEKQIKLSNDINDNDIKYLNDSDDENNSEEINEHKSNDYETNSINSNTTMINNYMTKKNSMIDLSKFILKRKLDNIYNLKIIKQKYKIKPMKSMHETILPEIFTNRTNKFPKRLKLRLNSTNNKVNNKILGSYLPKIDFLYIN